MTADYAKKFIECVYKNALAAMYGLDCYNCCDMTDYFVYYKANGYDCDDMCRIPDVSYPDVSNSRDCTISITRTTTTASCPTITITRL